MVGCTIWRWILAARFSAFCARLLPHHESSQIGQIYLPLIPGPPTDPSLPRKEMIRLVQTSQTLGDTWTVITGDQATYELAVAIRDRHKDEFPKVVLLFGGFCQAHNYLKAICKILRDSGVEELLVSAGMCNEGTAKKMFGEKAVYCQSLHAIRILSEAFWHLYWEAFERWASEEDIRQWKSPIEKVLKVLLDDTADATEQLQSIRACQPRLAILQNQMLAFQKSLEDLPTALFCLNFLEMSDILHRFIYQQREGNWLGHFCESARMLPFHAAAGHFKYSQQSLPLYLFEMKRLPQTAPEVHEAMLNGAIVGRRADGHHNAVSPNMLLKQTYKADAKEESAITLNIAARTKWVYTKPVTVQLSAYPQDGICSRPHTKQST